MARYDDSREVEKEMRDALRSEPFSCAPYSRLVKVLGLNTPPDPQGVAGYVTSERFIVGLVPSEIEAALGMKVRSLAAGCNVYRLSRIPGPSEVTYELTTHYPDGLAYGPTSHPDYPPSPKKHIHQWCLTTRIPVVFLRSLASNQPYAVFS